MPKHIRPAASALYAQVTKLNGPQSLLLKSINTEQPMRQTAA